MTSTGLVSYRHLQTNLSEMLDAAAGGRLSAIVCDCLRLSEIACDCLKLSAIARGYLRLSEVA